MDILSSSQAAMQWPRFFHAAMAMLHLHGCAEDPFKERRVPQMPIEWERGVSSVENIMYKRSPAVQKEHNHRCMRGTLPMPGKWTVATTAREELSNHHVRGESCGQPPEGMVDILLKKQWPHSSHEAMDVLLWHGLSKCCHRRPEGMADTDLGESTTDAECGECCAY